MHVFIDTTSLLKLKEANYSIRCQRIMFTSASHELRTPLNGVINFYSLIEQRFESMLKGNDNELRKCEGFQDNFSSIKKYIKLGLCSSKQLLCLIEDILDLSKFESGIFSMSKVDFVPKSLVKDVTDIFDCQCEQKKVELSSHVDPVLAGMVM